MTDTPVKVGGELEAYCTSCKIMKDHVVVAMMDTRPAKVECLGCHKQHVYRAGPPGSAKPRAASRRAGSSTRPTAAAAAVAASELEARLSAAEAAAPAYSAKSRFEVDQVLRHPIFGTGLVVSLPGAQKMEVAFRDGRRLLVHDRGTPAPADALAPPDRGSADGEPARPVTDAPPRQG